VKNAEEMKDLVLEVYRNHVFVKKLKKNKDKHFGGLTIAIEKAIEGTSLYIKKGYVKEGDSRRKKWDYAFYDKTTDELKMVIEAKSINEKSIGNNINNRFEEAVGVAVYNKCSYPQIKRGYLMVLDLNEDKKGLRFADRCKKSFDDLINNHDIYDAMCLLLPNFQDPEVTEYNFKQFFEKLGLL